MKTSFVPFDASVARLCVFSLVGSRAPFRDCRQLLIALVVAFGIPAESALGQFTAIEVPKGYVQLQGDIITTEAAATELRAEMQGIQQSFVYAPSRLWPNRVVPFDFDSNVTANQQSMFLAAMTAWQNSFPGITTITFQPRNNETAYLHLVVADPGFNGGSTDYVGYSGGRVTITVHPNAVNNVGLISHEVGHALGLWHEQSRSDRDAFIKINPANIQSGQSSQFDPASPQSTFGPYDYDSIMHYFACAFSVCDGTGGRPSCSCSVSVSACDTIQVVAPFDTTWQCSIGQRSHLSAMDRRSMAFMYGPADWRFLYSKTGSIADGSFQQPYQTVAQVVASVLPGTTLWLGPGSYSAAGRRISTRMTLRAAIADLQLQSDGSLGPSASGVARLQ